MDLSSWEANSHSASREIPRASSTPKIHDLVHKSQLLVPLLSQMDSVCTFPPYFPRVHLRLGLLSGLFPSRFWARILHALLNSPIPVTCLGHLILIDSVTLIIFSEL